MTKNRPTIRRPWKSLDELVEYFDSHDMGDYLEQMPEVEAEIAITKRTHLVGIDDALFGKLSAIAKAKRTSVSALVNSLLKEKAA
jgi:isocitrate lyase